LNKALPNSAAGVVSLHAGKSSQTVKDEGNLRHAVDIFGAKTAVKLGN